MKRLVFACALSLTTLLMLSPALFAQDAGDMSAPPAYGSSEGGDPQPSAAPDDNGDQSAPDTDMQNSDSPNSDSNSEAQSPDSQNSGDDSDQNAPQQYQGDQGSGQGDSD
ncbi:MAG: hypothetical protein ACREQN_12650 [Candidatus Binataceae bacterium]